jgi:hypothetical protein
MRWLINQFAELLQPAARRFERALAQPEMAQSQVQQTICRRLAASQYGQALKIQTVADWERVPIVTYEDLRPWILADSDWSSRPMLLPGKPRTRSLLTPERIVFYEQTSGSEGAAKLIPYTRSLRQAFNQMFCVWAYDLIRQGPAFSTGKLYFCISPQFDGAHSAGLNDDSEYLDIWLRLLLSPFLVSPQGVHTGITPEQFKYQVCSALLQAESLETISIWSPSFLTVMLNYIEQHRQAFSVKLSRTRQQLLNAPEVCWPQLWPQLKLISCWDSVYAADPADYLRQLFPNTFVQGKGLLATEAPLTIPLIAAEGAVPVLDQVFFEFEDQSGEVYKLHQLQLGETYQVLISQTAGLYRYRIGDSVRVSHFYGQTPCLEFLGRSRATSDLVGEKLHASFVQQVLQQLDLACGFKALAPMLNPCRYVLLLDRADRELALLSQQLDAGLSASPHYRHARCLGQLAPPEVMVSRTMAEALIGQQRWGNRKHPILLTQPLTQRCLIV